MTGWRKTTLPNDRPPNWRDEKGNFYLLRCFACTTCPRGTENYGPAVATGICAWCGAGAHGREEIGDRDE